MRKSVENYALCQPCETIFTFDTVEDVFSGETFCPVCTSRIEKNNKFTKLKQAEKKAVGYRILK